MPQVRQDQFPSLIALAPQGVTTAAALSPIGTTAGARQVNTARIIVTESRVIIARDGAQGPELIFSEAYDPATYYKNPDRLGVSYLTTQSGTDIAFIKDTTCGCGSRLRSWNPYNTINSSKNPTE
jgi:hypothetical protein